MFYRKLIIWTVSVVSIVLAFQLPAYNYWLHEHLVSDKVSVWDELHHLGEDDRMGFRFGGPYALCKAIEGKFEQIKDPVFLIPSNDYLRSIGIGFPMPEPPAFFYFTGLRAVSPDAANVQEASWIIAASKDKSITVLKVKDRAFLDSFINVYKRY